MKAKVRKLIQPILAVGAAAFIVSACGGGGDGTAGSGRTGTLQVAMTDAPSCGYDNIFVTVERIRVNTSATANPTDAGWQELILSRPQQVDLLALQNGIVEELGAISLPSGNIQQVRFVLSPNTVPTSSIDLAPGSDIAQPANHLVLSSDGSSRALTTPSGQQTGSKINVNIEVAAGQTADLLVDFDACKSIVEAGNSGRFLLKPVLTAIPRLDSGVRGTVADTQVLSGMNISLQQDGVVVRATAPVQSTDLAQNGNFVLSPVPPGTYDLVVTAPGFATKVITGVTVAQGTLLNLDPTPATASIDENEIVLVAATEEGDAAGTVTNTASTKPPTFVEINQTLTGARKIQIAARQLSFDVVNQNGSVSSQDTSTYLFGLPVSAPTVATYAAATTLVYSLDTNVAGQYSVVAVSAPIDQPAVVQSANANFDPARTVMTPRQVITNNFNFSQSSLNP